MRQLQTAKKFSCQVQTPLELIFERCLLDVYKHSDTRGKEFYWMVKVMSGLLFAVVKKTFLDQQRLNDFDGRAKLCLILLLI